MTKKYRVLFQGLTREEDIFRAGMKSLGVDTTAIDKLIGDAPIIMRGDLTLSAARRYAEVVQEAGGRVTIQEHGYFKESRRMNHNLNIPPFQNFTMCPRCGLKQQKEGVCARCGFGLDDG